MEASRTPSYRDKVLELEPNFDLQLEEIVRLVMDELYLDMEHLYGNDQGRRLFNPNPTVQVKLEEYEQWCGPWKFSLIVRLMGKKMGVQEAEISGDRSGMLSQSDVDAENNLGLNPDNLGNIMITDIPSNNEKTNCVQHPPIVGDESSDDKAIFGPWMLVKRNPHKKASKKDGQAHGSKSMSRPNKPNPKNQKKPLQTSKNQKQAIQPKNILAQSSTSAPKQSSPSSSIPEEGKESKADWEREIMAMMNQCHNKQWES
ncbi:hypothetical protein SESBI_19747 [Sesbania bispinosa]|nr:hypothetical protein SESBI_19747 [Sesbania bispinosa]